MKRIATLIVAGALVLAISSTASAQVNLSFGGGRGTTLSFGQPAYGYGGYGFAQPGGYGYTQRSFYGSPYGGYASPYAGYNAYSAYTGSPYATGTTYYSSGYRGYAAPATTIIRRSYTTSPYGYGYGRGYGYGNAYPYSGYANPYGAYQGVPLIRGNGFGINLMPR